ncbi:MAG: amino acid permease [Bacteroides sp. SM23_62_1]|nr:MAG: amino acid permease [Bacteroides sp. SM23_62_1]
MKNKFGLNTAIAIVVANMIGTGIFTSLGFQVISLKSGFALLLLWFIGGIAALTGALAYAELGTSMPRSGGEYHFLSRIYHPSLGFAAGWISFIIGFAAPTAAAAIALGSYFTAALNIDVTILGLNLTRIIAVAVIILITALHSYNKTAGAYFQNFFTALKIITLLGLIILGLLSSHNQPLSFSVNRDALLEIISPAFAISLFFVSYSYSGWNAAAYIAGELNNPDKNIPRSLITGTLIVTVLYIFTTYVFLKVIPIEAMTGKIEIGYIFGNQIFGEKTSVIMGLLFSMLLLSTVSSMIITGPRVTQVMGEDYSILRWFARLSGREIPVRAILTQAAISIIYVLTSTFEQVITIIGFTLNLFTLLAVIGMMLNRRRGGPVGMYRTKLYPVIPIIFIVINIWILVYGMIYRPVESLTGIGTSLVGLIFYFIDKKHNTGKV